MARTRLTNIFGNGVPVYLSMSGGKDSIVLASLVYDLIREGAIDPKQLVVVFVDEEAMHEEVIRVTEDWRKKFLKVGAAFDWWCIEVKHFNCFNQLSNDESFICWDREARERWVRPMPRFAKTEHPLLRKRVDTYQDFLRRISKDGISITGVRVAESVQRLQAFRNSSVGEAKMFKPIYDWKDTDVWLYIRDHRLDFPETYLHLYQVGQSKREMRLSQFFSVDTAKVLVKLSEHAPKLMERVIRREPNAYLASLYWDSEMFRRTGDRKTSEETGKVEEMNYEEEVWRILRDPEDGLKSPTRSKAQLAKVVYRTIQKFGGTLAEKSWKGLYGALKGGDPKTRTVRAVYFWEMTEIQKQSQEGRTHD